MDQDGNNFGLHAPNWANREAPDCTSYVPPSSSKIVGKPWQFGWLFLSQLFLFLYILLLP